MKRVVVVSGAGLSKESGLDTFRKGGMWDGMNVRDVAYADRWWGGSNVDRQRMLDFYNMRRREVLGAQPNAAHLAIAELEREGADVAVITQNVDDLHERAGSSGVLHLHGEVLKARPEDDESTVIPWTGDIHLGTMHEATQLRPHIVWFGEQPLEMERALDVASAKDVDALIVVGTTLEVGPANLCAFFTKARRVYLVDPLTPGFGVIDRDRHFPYVAPERQWRQHPDVVAIEEPATVGVRRAVDEILAG